MVLTGLSHGFGVGVLMQSSHLCYMVTGCDPSKRLLNCLMSEDEHGCASGSGRSVSLESLWVQQLDQVDSAIVKCGFLFVHIL